jgi:hypothetical protein
MAHYPRQTALTGPATIAIHDHRHMSWQAERIQSFRQAKLFVGAWHHHLGPAHGEFLGTDSASSAPDFDFESVRAQVFKPFNPVARHSVANKVVWLRLHIARADTAAGPLLLRLIPAHIGDVTLYSPSQAPGIWNKRELEPEELISKIKLG